MTPPCVQIRTIFAPLPILAAQLSRAQNRQGGYVLIATNWSQVVVASYYRHPPQSQGGLPQASPRQSLAGARILPYNGESPGWRDGSFLPAACPDPVAWLPVWLPDDGKGVDIRMLSCAPTATRTRDLLLRRHSRSMPWCRPMWPDVGSGRNDNGWIWPGVARCLASLAPHLAPREFVSSANVRMVGNSRQPNARLRPRPHPAPARPPLCSLRPQPTRPRDGKAPLGLTGRPRRHGFRRSQRYSRRRPTVHHYRPV